jgi:ribosomal protein S27AE
MREAAEHNNRGECDQCYREEFSDFPENITVESLDHVADFLRDEVKSEPPRTSTAAFLAFHQLSIAGRRLAANVVHELALIAMNYLSCSNWEPERAAVKILIPL